MMQSVQQGKRCVFDISGEDKPPTEESFIKQNKKEEDALSIKKYNQEEDVDIKGTDIEEKTIVDMNIKPKKQGNVLYTITSNVKTANGKFLVTKIIEESDEKKAKILYEKTIKKELGKPRSITKLSIKGYSAEDKEIITPIIENNVQSKEKKELSLFEQALEILCTSPFIHIFRIPSPKKGIDKFFYAIYENKEHLRDSLKENLDEVQNEIDDADFKLNELNREDRKEAEKIISTNERLYQKMVTGAKQLSGQDIHNDKNALKYIGRQDDEWYKTVIKIHEEKKYENENKINIAKKNINTILESDKINLYVMQLQEFDNSSVLIAAHTSKQANQIGMCSEYVINLLRGNNIKDGEKITVNAKVIKLDKKSISKICEDDDLLNDLISRETFTTQLIIKNNFSLDKIESFLDKVNKINNMTEKEKDIAIKKLVSKNFIPKNFKERIKFISNLAIRVAENKPI